MSREDTTMNTFNRGETVGTPQGYGRVSSVTPAGRRVTVYFPGAETHSTFWSRDVTLVCPRCLYPADERGYCTNPDLIEPIYVREDYDPWDDEDAA